jgi:hypothetical protein
MDVTLRSSSQEIRFHTNVGLFAELDVSRKARPLSGIVWCLGFGHVLEMKNKRPHFRDRYRFVVPSPDLSSQVRGVETVFG